MESEKWQEFRNEANRREAEDRERYEQEKDKVLDALWDAWQDTNPGPDEKWVEPPYPEFQQTDYFSRLYNGYMEEKQKPVFPDSKPKYDGGLDTMRRTVSLRGKTLQAIVKLANIILVPEKPEYTGGTWHVEGKHESALVLRDC